ncbi:AAA family ATPase [Mesorhizobium sp. M0771]|uniref:AAA family ATPase n=1 Tax=Mesorhizobium sp. M0771 TaxID=2956997 RepID=UPI00333CE5F0
MSAIPDPKTAPPFNPTDASTEAGAKAARRTEPFPTRPIGSSNALGKRTYLVEGLIDEGSLVLMYGAPGAGKSFLLLSLLASIATGTGWLGRTTMQGSTFYVGSEGRSLRSLRVKAWMQDQGSAVDNCIEVDCDFNFSDPRHVARLIETLKEHQKKTNNPPLAVGIDTLSRAIPGLDENAAATMSTVVDACQRISKETGAAVILVHHTGKSSDEARGNSALLAGLDTSLLIKRDGARNTLTVKKQRDGETGQSLTFRLKPVDVKVDDKTKETSAVPELISDIGTQADTSGARPNPDDGAVLRMLDRMIPADARYAQQSNGDDTPFLILLSDARKRAVAELWKDVQPDARRNRFNRSIKRLASAGEVSHDAQGYILVAVLGSIDQGAENFPLFERTEMDGQDTPL